jgi:hypothetical protein
MLEIATDRTIGMATFRSPGIRCGNEGELGRTVERLCIGK